MTLRDVAKQMGCSVATVSNAINGRGRMSEERRAEILKRCAELNFVPNSAGRSLRLQRTDAVGVIYAPSFAELFGNVFYARIMEGLAETFGEAGIDLMLGHEAESGELPRIVRQGKVDALVVLAGVFEPDTFVGLEECPVPMCLVDTKVDTLRADSLTSDGYGGGRQVAEYFLKQGHRDVVMLAYDAPIYNIAQRIAGFLDGLREGGVDAPEEQLIIRIKDDDEGVEQLVHRLGQEHAPTAVFAVNDTLADHLITGLRTSGFEVPDERNEEIRLVTRRLDEQVEVRIEDDGPGIPEDLRERIFEPFFTTKAAGAGSGLGLDIVRQLVERHQGRIEVDDAPGGGAIFRVRLPVLTKVVTEELEETT